MCVSIKTAVIFTLIHLNHGDVIDSLLQFKDPFVSTEMSHIPQCFVCTAVDNTNYMLTE